MNRLQDCFDDDDASDNGACPLFHGMCFDPAHDTMHLHQRDHSPTLGAWIQHEPSGPCLCVDGQNLYASPVDKPVNPINPLGGHSL